MRGRIWLNYFVRAFEEFPLKAGLRDDDWTEFMGEIMDSIGEQTNCYVARLRKKPQQDEYSGEYLNIDAVFIDDAEFDLAKTTGEKWDPFVMPRAVVELENAYDQQKIAYSLWKLLCVRAPMRALVCYQRNGNDVTSLRKHLEDILWRGSLTKGTEGDLIVIIGNEELDDDASWGDYFTVFEWRNDSLQQVRELEW